MRGSADKARKVRNFVRSLAKSGRNGPVPAVGDPLAQLVLGIFSRDVPEQRAREVLDRLQKTVVDFNELRVIPPIELAVIVGDISDSRLKCEDLSRALNRMFASEHYVSNDILEKLSRREAVAYLDKIEGLEPYTRARVRLLGLKHHAIPLDEAMLAYARKRGLVDARASHAQAQSFLEKHVPEAEALRFIAALKKQAWGEMATAVKKGSLERIRSVPPDRTSRNMLRLVASGGMVGPGGAEITDAEAPPAAKEKGSRGARQRPDRKPRPPKKARAARPKRAARSKSVRTRNRPAKKAARGKSARRPAKRSGRTRRGK
jgi:endonuclease III